jgi:hypothetical protein
LAPEPLDAAQPSFPEEPFGPAAEHYDIGGYYRLVDARWLRDDLSLTMPVAVDELADGGPPPRRRRGAAAVAERDAVKHGAARYQALARHRG